MAEEKKPELQFPLVLPLKVMGRDADDFEALVLELMARHVPAELVTDVQRRSSSGGKYLSLTVTFTAQDRTQMEAVYSELSRHERVLWVL
jgi:hypothetical protein